MFGVPFDCNEPLSPEDFGRCLTAINEGTRSLALKGAKLLRLRYEKGTLYLIPDQGAELAYLLKRGCPGCPD